MGKADIRPDALCVVGNIPSAFRSPDLRAFFRVFVDHRAAFAVFHYRHRPEDPGAAAVRRRARREAKRLRRDGDAAAARLEPPVSLKQRRRAEARRRQREEADQTCCCVVALQSPAEAAAFVDRYNGRQWSSDADGGSGGGSGDEAARWETLCVVERLQLPDVAESDPHAAPEAVARKSKKRRSRGVRRQLQRSIKARGNPVLFSSVAEVLVLPEMSPPTAMPEGNVGTTSEFLWEAIRQCRLPSRLITRLGLADMRRIKQTKGAAIPYSYDRRRGAPPSAASAGGRLLAPGGVSHRIAGAFRAPPGEADSFYANDDSGGGDQDAEEWERYEALHDRAGIHKERSYETKVEQTWEKGGPAIVWYTDKTGYWDPRAGNEPGTLHHKEIDDLYHDIDETDPGGGRDRVGPGGGAGGRLVGVAGQGRGRTASRYGYEVDVGVIGDRDLLEGATSFKFGRPGGVIAGRRPAQSSGGPDSGHGHVPAVALPRHYPRPGESEAGSGSGSGSGKAGGYGAFEAHTRAVGSRIMRMAGWRPGEGLGSRREGRVNPILVERRERRRGLGYAPREKGPGSSSSSSDSGNQRRAPAVQRRYSIATVYDDDSTFKPDDAPVQGVQTWHHQGWAPYPV